MEMPIGSNWKFYHLAIIVKDMDETKKKYCSILGPGVFRTETVLDSSTFSQYEVYGTPTVATHKSRFNHTDIGTDKLDVEFISPIEGKSIYRDFLDKHGEGIHHIAFLVDDLDAEMAKLVSRGIGVITSVKRPNGRGFAYFDFGDCLVELVGAVKL
jgi:methylmalonyl-CoA/ethylmalonyl-CoA epimerase